MKIKKGYIEIQADTFSYWYGKLLGLKEIKASACFPFIFVTNKIHPNLHDAIINHELIHFAQQKEMLLIGWGIWSCIEALYSRLFLRKSLRDTYLFHSAEQEAYQHMFDLEYLKKRKPYTHLKQYLKDKPVSWASMVTTFFKVEGFPIVNEHTDIPNMSYPVGANKGKVAYYILSGSISFFGNISKVVTIGERFDIPSEVEHSAIIGSQGCTYVVAQELDESV